MKWLKKYSSMLLNFNMLQRCPDAYELKQGVNERGLNLRFRVGDFCTFAALPLTGLLLHACAVAENLPPLSAKTLRVAGMQMEFPIPVEVIGALDKLLAADPATEL